MSKFNPYVRQEDIHRSHLQIVYLANEGVSYEQIAEITGYAVSTIRTYVRKYAEFMAEANRTFADYYAPAILKVDKYKSRNTGVEIPICYLEGCGEDVPNQRAVYLFKFYCGGVVNSKIGTTERSINQRVREELRGYIKDSGWEIERVEIARIISTGEYDPVFTESELRGKFIKYHKHFKKNDRFMNLDIPVEEFEEIVMRYLEENKGA